MVKDPEKSEVKCHPDQLENGKSFLILAKIKNILVQLAVIWCSQATKQSPQEWNGREVCCLRIVRIHFGIWQRQWKCPIEWQIHFWPFVTSLPPSFNGFFFPAVSVLYFKRNTSQKIPSIKNTFCSPSSSLSFFFFFSLA